MSQMTKKLHFYWAITEIYKNYNKLYYKMYKDSKIQMYLFLHQCTSKICVKKTPIKTIYDCYHGSHLGYYLNNINSNLQSYNAEHLAS